MAAVSRGNTADRAAAIARAIRAARIYRRGVTAGQRELARAYDCSRTTLACAVVIHRARPELLDEVLAGRLRLTEARLMVRDGRAAPARTNQRTDVRSNR